MPTMHSCESQERGITRWSRQLWSSDYTPILEAERAVGRQLLPTLPQSSYRRRVLKGDAAEAYDEAAARRVGSMLSQLQRATNQENWPFSVVARSVSYLNQRVPRRVWLNEQQDRRLAARESVTKVLRHMLVVAPECSFVVQPNVFVSAADQTYCYEGCGKRGRHYHQAGEHAGGSACVLPMALTLLMGV